MSYFGSHDLDGYTIGDWKQDQALDRRDGMNRMLTAAGITIETTVYLSGYVSHKVMQDGTKIGTRSTLAAARQLAEETLWELAAQGAIGVAE